VLAAKNILLVKFMGSCQQTSVDTLNGVLVSFFLSVFVCRWHLESALPNCVLG